MDKMRVTCKHCGRAHPSYECKYRDTKSTAALMEVQTKAKGGSFVHKGEAQSNGSSVAQSGERPPAGGRSGVQIPPTAGTQALPVDTNPERPVVVFTVTDHGSSEAPSAGTGEDKDRQPNSGQRQGDSNGASLIQRDGSPASHLPSPKAGIKPLGRPRIHPDRKAYKAAHERTRRARKKERGNV